MTNLFKSFSNAKYASILMSDPTIRNTRLAARMLRAIGINI
jgi:hypothetical protein